MKLELMNAAGTAKTVEHIEALARSNALSELTLGTIAFEPRVINEGKTFWPKTTERLRSATGTLNSLGLPGGGLEALREMLPILCTIAKSRNKKLRVSISGSNIVELMALAQVIFDASMVHGIEITIEINLGCPNVWDGGKQKEIWSFNPVLMLAAGAAVYKIVGVSSPVDLKLSPFTNPKDLNAAIDVVLTLKQLGARIGIVYSNALPNCFLWDDPTDDEYAEGKMQSAITPGDGLAGGAGKGNISLILGGIRQFQKKLPPDVGIIGVSGIHDGWSLAQYLGLGVRRVQLNSEFYGTEDRGVFTKILMDFAKNYPRFAEQQI